jgi:hypothetical protein
MGEVTHPVVALRKCEMRLWAFSKAGMGLM